MMIPNSVKFRVEASRCELACQLAIFLEVNVPSNSYDFALSDLLYFRDEQVLSELRENPRWQALESQFTTVGGLILEDWDDDAITSTPINQKLATLKSLPTAISKVSMKIKLIGLMVFLIFLAVGVAYGRLNPPSKTILQELGKIND